MIDNIKEWLATYFNTDKHNITNVLNNERATLYLLIWPIMEQYVFDGFMKERDIEIIAGKMQSHYNEMDLELTVKHFYTRYQDPQKFKHLYHKETVLSRKILVLLQTDYDDLTNEEKLRILLFVAYRYRNNIFHGNKGVLSWKNYSEQIDLCLKFMMSLVECAKNHSEDIK